MKQKYFIQLLKYGHKHIILTISGIVLSAVYGCNAKSSFITI